MTGPADADALLERFRDWLSHARDAREAGSGGPGPAPEAGPGEVGLYRLAEEFTALRHELRLQTKAGRGLQEQAEALLPALGRAIEQFRAVEPKEAQAAWGAARPLALALADLDEALDRGRAEIEKARAALVDEPATALVAALDGLLARQRWPWRGSCRAYHLEARRLVADEAQGRRRHFEALLEGYDLVRARLARALAAERIERIDAVGRPVDPARMVVVEVVDDLSRPAGSVLDELRRGYTWRGRVLREAEVRAVRSPAGDGGPADEDEDDSWDPDEDREPDSREDEDADED